MSKELKALDDLFCVYFDNKFVKSKYGITEKTARERYDLIKKSLEALEIISKKLCLEVKQITYPSEKFSKYILCFRFQTFVGFQDGFIEITEEEYDLLKEALE